MSSCKLKSTPVEKAVVGAYRKIESTVTGNPKVKSSRRNIGQCFCGCFLFLLPYSTSSSTQTTAITAPTRLTIV